MADLVKMELEGKTADVHPDEVDNFKRGGWIVVSEPTKQTVKRTANSVKSAEK